MYQAIVFLPLLGAILAATLAEVALVFTRLVLARVMSNLSKLSRVLTPQRGFVGAILAENIGPFSARLFIGIGTAATVLAARSVTATALGAAAGGPSPTIRRRAIRRGGRVLVFFAHN